MALLIVTAFPGLSQEDTIRLPFSVAKQVALDLEELDRLRAVDKVNSLELAKYRSLVEGLEKTIQDRETQVSLLHRSVQLRKTQYDSEKAKKPKFSFWQKVKIGCAGFLAGYLAAKI